MPPAAAAALANAGLSQGGFSPFAQQMQSILQRPEQLQALLRQNPQAQRIIEANPMVGTVLQDQSFLQQLSSGLASMQDSPANGEARAAGERADGASTPVAIPRAAWDMGSLTNLLGGAQPPTRTESNADVAQPSLAQQQHSTISSNTSSSLVHPDAESSQWLSFS